MDKVLKFFTSPLGKFLIIAIVIIVVSYISYLAYQKKIYNGSTKNEIEKGIVDKVATTRISEIKATDNNYINNLYSIEDILRWYDNNDNRLLKSEEINSYLTSKGISKERFEDFQSLVGTPIILVNYV